SESYLGASVSTSNNYATPRLSVHGSVPLLPFLGAMVESVLHYFFRVDRVAGVDSLSDIVRIHIEASGAATGTSGSTAPVTASATLKISGESSLVDSIACASCIFGSNSFHVDSYFDIKTGIEYQIDMLAVANLQGGQTADVYVDPFISVPE